MMKESMGNAPDDQRDAIPALLFRVRSRLCALPLAHVVETMRPLPIEPLDGAPVAVMGVALIRGEPLPVVALAILLDGEDEPATRLITVRAGESRIALLVGSVVGVLRIAATSLCELPPLLGDADHNVVTAISTADAELLLVLNAARLVPDGLLASLNGAAT